MPALCVQGKDQTRHDTVLRHLDWTPAARQKKGMSHASFDVTSGWYHFQRSSRSNYFGSPGLLESLFCVIDIVPKNSVHLMTPIASDSQRKAS